MLALLILSIPVSLLGLLSMLIIWALTSDNVSTDVQDEIARDLEISRNMRFNIEFHSEEILAKLSFLVIPIVNLLVLITLFTLNQIRK